MSFTKKETHIVEAVVSNSNFTLTITGTKNASVYNYVEADLDIDIKDQERVSLKLNSKDLEALVDALAAIGYKKSNSY